MLLEKEGGGTRIIQPNPEIIKVIEGGGSARVIGILMLLGGIALIWSTLSKISYMTLTLGIVLALFGAALATQRYVMTLDRQRGKWSCGGDVFFLISFKSLGYLQEVGPVRITKLASNPREHDMGKAIITYPVSVEAKKIAGNKTELNFGKHWSLKEAHGIATALAEYLDKPVQDDSE